MRIWVSLTLGIGLVILLLSILISGSTIASSSVQTCNVPGDYSTIQDAVNDPGCNVVIVGNGTYYERVAITRTVTVQGQGPNKTTINGTAGGSVLSIDASSVAQMTVNLNGLRITNGSTNSGSGGGIHNIEATLAMTNCVVDENWASGWGGGIYSESGELHLANSTISQNEADTGGGVYIDSGTATISNSLITYNEADFHAGGLYNMNGNVSLDIVSVRGNTTYVDGGGIFNYGTMTINNSSINNNESTNYSGGGIRNEGTMYINNSTISDNKAIVDEAGVDNESGILRLSSSTVTKNVGGGIGSRSSDVRVQNSIVSDNSPDDCRGTVRSDGYNIIEDTSSCNYQIGVGDLVSTSANLGPMEGQPAYYPLLPGPGVNDGNPAGCTNHLGQVLHADQRGVLRSDRCDIGAVEYVALSIQKTAPTVAEAGELISYTLTVASHHTDTLTTLVVTDALPVGANYVSGGSLVGNVVSWTIPSLAAGEMITPQFMVTATETITNSDYRVSSDEGFSARGEIPVVTMVEFPIAGLTATSDSPTVIGDPTNLTATVSSGSNVLYTWDFGDGKNGNGANLNHTYPSVGVYTAVVTATNSVSSDTATTMVVVTEANFPVYIPVVIKD